MWAAGVSERARVAEHHRYVGLVDGQGAVARSDAVVRVRAHGHGDRIGADVRELEGRGGQGVAERVGVHGACDRRRKRRVGITVILALGVRGHGCRALVDGQGAICKWREVVVRGCQRSHCAGNRVASCVAGGVRRAAAGRKPRHPTRTQRLAILEPAQGGREGWVRVAIGAALRVGGHRQMRLADLPGAAGGGGQCVIAREHPSNWGEVACREDGGQRRGGGHVLAVVCARGLGHGETVSAYQACEREVR